jgi:hypothetical protein
MAKDCFLPPFSLRSIQAVPSQKAGHAPRRERIAPGDRPPAIFDARPVPTSVDIAQRYFFSITHCKGCWCLRAKSITCVTLVSAIS